MQTIQKTRQEARARINVGLVKFDGVDAYAKALVSTNPRLYTFIDYDRVFSISFFINLETAKHTASGSSNTWPMGMYHWHQAEGAYYSGWGITAVHEGSDAYTLRILMRRHWPDSGFYGPYNLEPLRYNQTYHIYYEYDPVNLFAMYINGRKVAINQATVMGTITGSIWDYARPDLYLGGIPNLNSSYEYFTNGYLGQVAFFARKLTEQEIVYVKNSGGIIPLSAHRHCISHYPCNQAEGGSIYANETSFDYPFVEASNYSQPPLIANEEWDYTDVWVEIFNSQERSQAVRIMADTGKSYYLYHANYQIKAGDNINGHHLRRTVDIDTSYTHMKIKYHAGWLQGYYMRNGNWYHLDQIWIGDLNGSSFRPGISVSEVGKSARLESGGKQYTFDGTASSFYLGDGNRITKVARLSEQYRLQLFGISSSEHSGFNQTIYKDFYTKNNYRPYQDKNNDGAPDQPLKEVGSEMAPAVNAVFFQKSLSQKAELPPSFAPTNEKGYTVLLTFFHNSTSFTTNYSDCLYSKRILGDTQRCFFCYGYGDYLNVRGNGLANVAVHKKYLNLGNGISQLVASLEPIDSNSHHVILYGNGNKAEEATHGAFLNSLDQLDTLFNLAYDVYGSNRYYSGHLISFGLAKGIITEKQVIKLWNNSLLSAPRQSWNNLDWQCYLDFNQIFDNGTHYFLEGFNGLDAELFNFSASHLSSAVTNINGLRV